MNCKLKYGLFNGQPIDNHIPKLVQYIFRRFWFVVCFIGLVLNLLVHNVTKWFKINSTLPLYRKGKNGARTVCTQIKIRL